MAQRWFKGLGHPIHHDEVADTFEGCRYDRQMSLVVIGTMLGGVLGFYIQVCSIDPCSAVRPLLLQDKMVRWENKVARLMSCFVRMPDHVHVRRKGSLTGRAKRLPIPNHQAAADVHSSRAYPVD